MYSAEWVCISRLYYKPICPRDHSLVVVPFIHEVDKVTSGERRIVSIDDEAQRELASEVK